MQNYIGMFSRCFIQEKFNKLIYGINAIINVASDSL